MKLLGSLPVAMLMCTTVFAQTGAHKMDTPSTTATSEAQAAFDVVKALAGEWEGHVKTDFPAAKDLNDILIHVTMRVTSRGNSVVHEFQVANTPFDPNKYDHPVTMLYVDNDRLNLVHYCDAGNRPRMTATFSPDKKTVEFEFADLSGSNRSGHMHHAVFTVVDENHHIEEWTYMMPGDKPIYARFDLYRKTDAA